VSQFVLLGLGINLKAENILPLEDLILRLALTFLAMGVWVSVIVIATEKHGGKLGGFLVGIPSTSALSFFFTGLYVSPSAATDATNVFPVIMSLAGIMLLCFGFAARRGFAFGLILSVSVWLVMSFLVVYTEFNDFELSLVLSMAVSLAVYCGFRWRLKPRSTIKMKPKHTKNLFLLRFVFTGSVVALAVLMGQLGVPTLSGMLAAFPVLTISSLIAVQLDEESGGTLQARGMTMSMMVSIMLICIPYSIAVHYLYPIMGIIYGTAISFAVAIAIGIPYYFVVEDRLVPLFDPNPELRLTLKDPIGKGTRENKRSRHKVRFKATFLFKWLHWGTKI
jgi:hypothetical protein